MKRASNIAQILCFLLFLVLFFLLLLLLPRREFSEQENRYLAQPPRFRFSALVSGSFTRDAEDSITDQFPLRDRWIGLKSRLERAAGKTENNGVFFCSRDTLISRFPQPEEKQLRDALNAVNALTENTDVPVALALIPSSAEVWRDRLPRNADTADQAALIRELYAGCDADTVDILGALEARREEEIYYRTDHHWTTLGAYYGYAATAPVLGLEPAERDSFSPVTVTDSFYGTAYSSSGVRWLGPDSIERWVGAEGVSLFRGPEETPAPVYAEDKLETKDKYAYFLGGNTPSLIIRTGNGGGRLLVIRDSYSDCELPFFFAHYGEIHVLDLRYYRQSVQDYVRENRIDRILVNYSLSTFVSDTSVYLMGT